MGGGVRKGAWTKEEDSLLRKCVEEYGEGKWHLVPLRAGLSRCRKSCRLRWLNYLRPDIKRGGFCSDEVDLIVRLHKLLGNRWSLIAGRLPGRTANDVKNYWNTNHSTKCKSKQQSSVRTSKPSAKSTTTLPNSNIVKPRPRILTRHITIPSFSSHQNKSTTITPNINNHSSKRNHPSNEGFPSSATLENSAMDWFEGLFENDGKEVGASWSSQTCGEEEMERFWSEEVSTFLAGDNDGDGDDNSGNKGRERTLFCDNDMNKSAIIDMDIWDLLGMQNNVG